MADEILEQTEQQDNLVYIKEIQELKENSIDLKRYNKLKEERDMLVHTLTNGNSLASAEEKKARSLADCRKDFMTRSRTNIEHVEKLLALREAAMREGELDPFVSVGHHVKPTAHDFQRAEEIAQIYQECLDYADGDDKVFMNEIYRRIL